MDPARLLAAGRRVVSWLQATAYRVLDTVPPVRRAVDDLIRVEVIDRCMVIAAQALLALIPMLVVLAAFLPTDVTAIALERFSEITGVGQGTIELVEVQLDRSQVRTQTGVVGVLITFFSATSFARAVQRMYERVWETSHVGGLSGRRRCFLWLIGWLVSLQMLALLSWTFGHVDGSAVVRYVSQGAAASLIWWWTMHTLLFGRVGWKALAFPAALTGVAVVTYSQGSSLVMPRYAESSADQFGVLGLFLTVATWMVGFAGVMVIGAVLGRVVVEDTWWRARVRSVVPGSWGSADWPSDGSAGSAE